jgi:hypothetical protein
VAGPRRLLCIATARLDTPPVPDGVRIVRDVATRT